MRTQLNMCASALFHVGFSSDKGWRVAGGNQTIAPKIAERLGNRVKLSEPAFLRCLVDPYAQGGSVGIGSIHHIAMVVQDDDAQRRLMRRFNDMGVGSSRIVDRFWFKSVYFRDPEGNWPEIATKGPGYTGDESFDKLRTTLLLPAWLESKRKSIESFLAQADSENSEKRPPRNKPVPPNPESFEVKRLTYKMAYEAVFA